MPTMPEGFWTMALKEFRALRPRRDPTEYVETYEAMEESLWRSRVIEKVDTKYAKLWADELMIAQVKDWYRRENGLRSFPHGFPESRGLLWRGQHMGGQMRVSHDSEGQRRGPRRVKDLIGAFPRDRT